MTLIFIVTPTILTCITDTVFTSWGEMSVFFYKMNFFFVIIEIYFTYNVKYFFFIGVRMSSLVVQTFVSSKQQQNTLLQFVKKGEKVGKSETKSGQKCSNEESDIDTHNVLSSEKGDQLTIENKTCVSASGVCASGTHLNHCDNWMQEGTEKDVKLEIKSEVSETKAVMEHGKNIDTDLPERERRLVSGEGDSQDAADKSVTVWYTCPVCRDQVGCTDLHAFNHHIDSCLSRSVVKECSRYQPEAKTPQTKGTPSRKTVTPKRKSNSSKQVMTSIKTPPKPSVTKKSQDLNESVTQKTLLIPTISSSIDRPNENSTNDLKTIIRESSSDDLPTEPSICKNTEILVCPVCFMEQTGVDLDAFNQHVDSCLCKGTITEILKEQRHNNKRLVLSLFLIGVN